MKPLLKVGIVAGGYVAAFLLASLVVALRVAAEDPADVQASGGMYAFGDAMLFATVFGVAALVPTGAALFFLRTCRPVWAILSVAGLAVALTGVAAAILFLAARHAVASPVSMWVALCVPRMLLSPPLALGFILCAVIARFRGARLVLLAAAALEASVCVCGAAVWFIPMWLHRL